MKLPERSVETKLRSIADLRNLSISLRDAMLRTREPEFLEIVEQVRSGVVRDFSPLTLEALRYYFRQYWARNDFRSITEIAGKIPEEILRSDPVLQSYAAAAREECSVS